MHKSTTLFKSIIFFLLLFPVAAELCGAESYFILAQESKTAKIDTIKTTNSNLPNAPQVEQGDVDFTDGTNSLIRITDEGTFGAIEIKTGVPSTTTDKLYNDGGTLKFDGSSLGGGSGATAINDLTDAIYDGSSLFLGNGAGITNSGSNNTAVGGHALTSNTSGMNNTAVGTLALYSNINGIENTANGTSSLFSNTSGAYNTSSGRAALYNNTSGSRNVSYGFYSNFYNQTGSNNTIIGYEAGMGTTNHNKSGNVFLGYQAGYNEVGSNKLYISNTPSTPLIWGDFANAEVKINGNFEVTGNVTGVEINDLTDAKYDGTSLFLGVDAGRDDDGTTNENTAIGFRSLRENTSGSNNTAIGNSALLKNETGGSNTAIGKSALWANTSGVNNVAIGYRALESNTIKGSNTAIGTWALRDADANSNTAIGYFALYQTTTGLGNTALGNNTLSSNTIGKFNVGLGSGANQLNVEGDNNTAVGYQAGYGISGVSTSGNIFLGYRAGYSETSDNKLYIENSNSSSPLIWGDFANDLVAINGKFGVGTQNPDAKVTIIAASTGEVPLRIKIGGATKFKVEENGGVAIGLNSSNTPANGLYVHGDIRNQGGLLHTSDKRFKTNIVPIKNATERIKNIRGVYYDWNRAKFPERDFTNKKQIGVLAQEVEKEFPELVSTGDDGYKSVDYTKLAPILIEAVKEQQERFKYQDERIKTLEEENENLKIVIMENKDLRDEMNMIKATLNKLVKEQSPNIKFSKK